MGTVLPPVIRRSFVYVPSTTKHLAKSLFLKADTVTYDLEDSILRANKEAARKELRSHLQTLSEQRAFREVAVRINSLDTRLALPDLISLGSSNDTGPGGPGGISPNVGVIVVPKVTKAADLTFVADVLRHLCPERQSSQDAVRIVALIESARAVMNLPEICRATPILDGFIFGAEDFARDLSLARTPSLKEFQYARSAIATAARAANLSSCIDLVCTIFRGVQARAILEAECRDGKGMGFNGKQCIHPDQIETVNQLFSPSEEEVEWAVRVSIAKEKAEAQGLGAWALGQNMIDAPVIAHAVVILNKATRCGIDINPIREDWKSQEPE